MMRLCNSGVRLCDGLNRREFLRVGGLGVAGLTWPGLLRARAATKARARTGGAACIQLFMWGGPSQLETFDLKPNAPDGVRGEFRPIATNVPGVRICEHLPLLATMADQFAILRSVTHTGVNHGTSAYHMLTGRIHPTPGTLRHPTPDDAPHIGSTVARFGRKPSGNAELPRFVALPSVLHDGDGGEVPGQGPGILGAPYAPFQVTGDPSRPDFRLDTLQLPEDVDARRLRDRIGLRAMLDAETERPVHRPAAEAIDGHYERAFGLLESAAARRAFDVADEPDRIRDRYGWNHFGQSCLLARRLVEAGVPLVTVYWNTPSLTTADSWDTHADGFNHLKNHLLPPFDRAVTALLGDLRGRGLLDETLVVCCGEFGRTPKLNKNAGRDHWGFCQSVLVAGGGVQGGAVYGSSDASAAYAAELPISPDDLAATVFHTLGVNLDQEVRDAQGRPLPLCTGKPVLGLF